MPGGTANHQMNVVQPKFLNVNLNRRRSLALDRTAAVAPPAGHIG
jgi:hypothetical protein